MIRTQTRVAISESEDWLKRKEGPPKGKSATEKERKKERRKERIMTRVTSERHDARQTPTAASWSSAGASAEDGGVVTANNKVEDEPSRSRPAVVAERCLTVVRDSCGAARQCAARTWHRCNDTIAHAVS